MDPFLAKMIETGAMERLAVWHADHAAFMARQRDTALFGIQTINAITAKELLVSDDVSEASRINMATRIPTTIDHPSIPVSNPQNAGK